MERQEGGVSCAHTLRRPLLVTDYRLIGRGVAAECGVGYRSDKKMGEVLLKPLLNHTHTNNTQQTDQNDDSRGGGRVPELIPAAMAVHQQPQ
jgi:hypothetical protein